MMVEAHWHPDEIGRLTVGQLVVMSNERPPGARWSKAEALAYFAARDAGRAEE